MNTVVKAAPVLERGTRSVPKQIPRYQLQAEERVIDVPVVTHCDRIVEVPVVQVVDAEREVLVPEVQYLPRSVPKLHVQAVEKILEVPQQLYRERPGMHASI